MGTIGAIKTQQIKNSSVGYTSNASCSNVDFSNFYNKNNHPSCNNDINYLNEMYTNLIYVWESLDIDIVTAKNNKIIEIYANVESAEEFNKLSEQERNKVIEKITNSPNISKKVLKKNRKEVCQSNEIGFIKRVFNIFNKRLDKKLGITEKNMSAEDITNRVMMYIIKKYGPFEEMSPEIKQDVINKIKNMLIMSALNMKNRNADILTSIHAELSKYLPNEDIVQMTNDVIKASGLNSSKQALAFEKGYMSNITNKNPITNSYRTFDVAENLQEIIVKGLDKKGLKISSTMYQDNVGKCDQLIKDLKDKLNNQKLTDEERQELLSLITAYENYGVAAVTGYLEGVANGNAPLSMVANEFEAMLLAAKNTTFAHQLYNEVNNYLANNDKLNPVFKRQIEKTINLILNNHENTPETSSLVDTPNENNSSNESNENNHNDKNNSNIINDDAESFNNVTYDNVSNHTLQDYSTNTSTKSSYNSNPIKNNFYTHEKKEENNNKYFMQNNESNLNKEYSYNNVKKILKNPEEFYNYVKEENITDAVFCNLVFSEKNVNQILLEDALNKFENITDEYKVLIFTNANNNYYNDLLEKTDIDVIQKIKNESCYNTQKAIEKYEDNLRERKC